MRSELQTPWPENPQSGTPLAVVAERTPELDGSDPLERAPIVTVAPDQLLLDGQPELPGTLARDLMILQRNYEIIHPNESFNGLIDVLCPPQTDVRLLRSALGAVARARWKRVSFALRKTSIVERPMLGRLERTRWTATNALLLGVDAPEGGETASVELSRYRDCDAVVRAVDAVRRSGKWPVLE